MKEVQRWNDFPRSRGSQGQSGFNPHSWDSSYREHQSYKGWTAPNTGVPSDLTLSQICTPACFQNASNIKEIYLHKKKKKSIPQFPKTPLSGFTWLNLGNVIGDFILPKSTVKAGPEDYVCPSPSERSQEHVTQSVPLGCGRRHGGILIRLDSTWPTDNMNRASSEPKQASPRAPWSCQNPGLSCAAHDTNQSWAWARGVSLLRQHNANVNTTRMFWLMTTVIII